MFRIAAVKKVFLLLCLCLLPVSVEAANIDKFANVPTTAIQPRECTEEDQGSTQVSCKYIELGTIDGYLTKKEREDPRWRKIGKYWNNTDTWLKFAGVACARDNLQSRAEQKALERANQIVRKLIEEFEGDYFTGSLSNAGYRKFEEGVKCTTTSNTSKSTRIAHGADALKVDQSAAAQLAAERQVETERNAELQRQVEETRQANAKRAAELKAQSEARQRTATFIITNGDRYRLGLVFYSQTRKNMGWPGNNKQINLTGRQKFDLSCNRGEKICFGAWRDHQTITWGVGHNNRSCQKCCVICGNTLETTLTDGGPDSYPQVSKRQKAPRRSSPSNVSAGDALETFLNGVIVGGQIGQVIMNRRSSGGGTTTTHQQSDISGTGN